MYREVAEGARYECLSPVFLTNGEAEAEKPPPLSLLSLVTELLRLKPARFGGVDSIFLAEGESSAILDLNLGILSELNRLDMTNFLPEEAEPLLDDLGVASFSMEAGASTFTGVD